MRSSSISPSLGHSGQELRRGVSWSQVRHQLCRLRSQQQIHRLGKIHLIPYLVYDVIGLKNEEQNHLLPRATVKYPVLDPDFNHLEHTI